MNLRIRAYLSGDLHVQTRERYTFWDLLGDVGGFNDGLFLLAQFFMATYASFSFNVDYLDGKVVDSTSEARSSAF